jgi:long-chain acyl-CoA synthetase
LTPWASWAGERRLAVHHLQVACRSARGARTDPRACGEVNKLFARVENIRKFVILEKELDHDDGELTATQKVRRSIIGKKFARELEQIYGGGTA